MKRFLAFDLGASGGKLFTGAFDGRRLDLKPVYAFDNRIIELGRDMFWDFLGIYTQLGEGIARAQAQGPVFSLGIDSFNNDFSFIDASGTLLSPVRSYRDPRTIRREKAIYARMSPRTLYFHTGNQIAPFNTLMQLAAMREEGQGFLMDSADQLLFLPDLLAYYITGRRVTEYTVAAETQMLDLNKRDWIDEILDTYAIPRRLFAPLVMPGTRIGAATGAYRAQRGLKPFDFVSVCQHDTASAFLAAPLAGPGAAIISSGTWALMGVEVASPVISEEGYLFNLANEGSLPGHHRLLRNVMGSWIMQQLRADFAQSGEKYTYEAIQALAQAAKPFAYLIDPDEERFFLPGGMRRKIGEACRAKGLGAPGTPGEYFRCVYESLSLKYRWVLERLEQVTGIPITAVNIVGGGSLDDTASRFTANATGRPVTAGPANATSLGNILVQMLAFGDISSVEQGREIILRSAPVRRFEPCDEQTWTEQYQRFVRDILA